MKTNVEAYHTCGHCKRTLPLSAFYLNRQTGQPQNYCKECRCSVNRQSRMEEKLHKTENRKKERVILTQIEDPALRMQYLMKALSTVNENILRKKSRLKEEKVWDDG